MAGFGGITDYFTDLTHKAMGERYFHAADCANNTIAFGENRACVRHTNGHTMHIGTSFSAKFEAGSAKSMETDSPALFAGSTPQQAHDAVVKISAVIEQGQALDGYIVVIHDADDETLNQWLARKDAVKFIKQQILAKHACISLDTPGSFFALSQKRFSGNI